MIICRCRFDNIYYFCPSASFNSVEKHPFENHNKVYHDLDISTLSEIYNELVEKKDASTKKPEPKEKSPCSEEEDEDKKEEEEENPDIEYSVIILDDQADMLKNMDILKYLNKMIIKARHLCCSFIITLQAYSYCPKILRKQITYISIFRPKNVEEWYSIADEVLNLSRKDALILFDYCFDKQYNHLDLDTTNNNVYKNFDLLKIKY